MTMQLSPRQKFILNELKKGKAAYWQSGRNADYWFLSTSHETCTRQIEKLIKLDLVEIVLRDVNGLAERVIYKSSSTRKDKRHDPA